MDAAHSSPDFIARQKPLEQFRGEHGKRLEIHPKEKALLWLVSIHLCALPWAIGDMRPWSQIPSFALSVLGLVLALLPRHYTEEHTGSNSFRLIMWPKLLRFPLFWIGLALLGYIAIQALNPSWEYRSDGKNWWMRKIDYTPWLPTSVDAPFARWGPGRLLMIYATVWLTLCTLWVGITRRRTLQRFFTILAINGLALALFGLVQRFTTNGKIFWFWTSPNASFFSSFVYKNHGASYLLLALALTCGIAAWYYLRGLRRLEKSNPSGVFAFFATCIAVAILTSYARGATIVMLVFLCLCIGAFVVHQLRSGTEHRKPIVAIAMILIFGYFLKIGLETVQSREAWTRLKQGVMEQDASVEARRIATKASLEMLDDHWRAGTGAGSFRFLFPTYQQRHPQIFDAPGGSRMWWEHAHNDIVQFPIELGLVGTLLLLSGIGYLALALLKSYFWENPLCACVVLGLLALLASSWWDFPFQNPAILMLASALFVTAAMWARFEEAGAKS